MLGPATGNVNAAQRFGPGLDGRGATVRFVDTVSSMRRKPDAGPLRLAWVNPAPAAEHGEAGRPDLRLVPQAAVPPRPVKLDLAVERHLTGADGLTRDQFLSAFSGAGSR